MMQITGIRTRLSLLAIVLAGACAGAFAAPRAARALDLEAIGMEVTQTVQDLDNSVRLVARKDTWVRVHARVDAGDPVEGVVTRLFVSRVAPGPVTFLGTIDSPPLTLTTNPFRPNINSSFNFQLPYAWRSGTLHLIAVVDFLDEYVESGLENNALFVPVTFEQVPPIRLRMIGVDTPFGDLPGQIHFDRTASWLRRTFPTSALLMQQRTMVIPIDVTNPLCNCLRDMNGNCSNVGTCVNMPARACNDDDQDCGCAFLNELLLTQRESDESDDPDYEPDRRYAAIVDDETGFMRGCSPGVDAKVAAGPSGSASNGWDNDGSYTDWYTAHELGHAYGRAHSGCCGAPDGGPFPHDNCVIGTSEMAGFDALGPSAFTSSRRDVMSYCNNLWTSDFTFEAIMNRLQLEGGAPPPPPAGPGNFAIVVGNAKLDLDVANITNVVALPPATRASATPSGDGSWEIRFLDPSGGVMASHAFTPHEIADDRDLVVAPLVPDGVPALRTAVFAETVEIPAGTVGSLAIFHDGVELASNAVSASAPIVTLISPNGGETAGRSVSVSWTASDADGDALLASLSYSSDDGNTWKRLASQLPGTGSVDVDLAGLAGSSLARFRVDVSDGYHGASDTSDGVFSVANAAPQAVILAPGDATALASGQAVTLEAMAEDAEDGALEGAALEWSSDRQGVLGSGSVVEVGDELVPGTHVVTLVATDSHAASTAVSVTIVKGSSQADFCPAFPRDDCDEAAGGSLKLADKTGVKPPSLLFQLSESALHDGSVFGAPHVDSTEVLCLYEGGRLRDAVAVAPSATQWEAIADRGFRYRSAGSGGIDKALLKAGSVARPAPAKVVLKGKGSLLPPLRSSLELPVVAQFSNDAGTHCGSVTFEPGHVRKSADRLFVAKR